METSSRLDRPAKNTPKAKLPQSRIPLPWLLRLTEAGAKEGTQSRASTGRKKQKRRGRRGKPPLAGGFQRNQRVKKA
ncbi:MAG: hypothetical protein A2600_06880 [Candidatus Lambdaproteobacteria bacterium RIFOXYD1_FULL_56_27]|uniref:Uncharacterized protein n=1 Tax=Candidatus Lambdaproteobacteria bacterium RIFOXYD2_FULL_56_26 TaxID=1817773 RepID=A0A1F6GPX0_9PROT|nr:MAG: hypothetical protein A2557_05540 [Candidatus Lambdaproteobacteria bacterium RIFOXYD2_FULL_56_26]OGH03658.1 MAG: hypothetical protein A2426_00330 [Candidatus Lambdaproteobacteria bacterium RIFOXYC1_FULL_56_13]OGH07242.1 MAG: hypothetical protein A2600_06880 [Candidatus Lambdaproteobacteria bacterium RIFOXYD1_FULL_56_27]